VLMKKAKWCYFIVLAIINLAALYYIFKLSQAQVDLAIASELPSCMIGPLNDYAILIQITLHALALSLGLLVFTYQLSKVFKGLLGYQRKKFILISIISGFLPLAFTVISWLDVYCH